MKFEVVDFYALNVQFSVELVRSFRVLNKVPKCWEEITSCTTRHGTFENGSTTIYQSKTTKKFYMVRYFDGCFAQMYAEVSGVDWCKLRDTLQGYWNKQTPARSEMLHLYTNGEMSYAEHNARYMEMRNKGRHILLGMVA